MMPDLKPKKIVYLLGAGTTHAEKQLECKVKKVGLDKDGKLKNGGLLASHVSQRVIKRLINKKLEIAKCYGIGEFSLENPDQPEIKENADIELFISLIESLETNESEKHAKLLRKYFREDICNNLLTTKGNIQPRLHCSLIELHNLIKSIKREEQLLGFFTVNYDSVFEKSLKLTKSKLEYGFNIGYLQQKYMFNTGYFLKLHGSFDWHFDPDSNKITISSLGRSEEGQWIPPRLNKEYLNYPYNILHGKAYELLAQCDILRVIGCSLNQNDIGLISLLFKTQRLRRPNPYSIEIISTPNASNEIMNRLGILLSFDESFYKKDDWTKTGKDAENPFLDWLYYKVEKISDKNLQKTTYLKRIKSWKNL